MRKRNPGRRTTIRDIAADCDVSLTTVSLVMNDSPRVSAATRARVLEAIQRHGYEPNQQARALASRSTKTLGIVVPHLDHVFADVYFGEIMSGISDEAHQLGYKTLLEIARADFIETRGHIQLFRRRFIDGMIFIGASLRDDYLRSFEETPHPFLLANTTFPGSRLSHVVSDYLDAGRTIARHVLELGHQSIGLVRGALDVQTSRDFREGVIAELRTAGLSPAREDDGMFSEYGGMQAAERIVRAQPEVTALIAGNDKMAMGAMKRLHDLGLAVPDGVSVVGVDDIPQASYTVPSLTTMRQDLYLLGVACCRCLNDLILGTTQEAQKVLPMELVVRESSAPPRGRSARSRRAGS